MIRRWFVPAACAVMLAGVCGCPVVNNLPTPGRSLQQQDPQLQRDYRLYVPSHYTAGRPWPLVVTCHGTRPYDTAPAQFKEWAGYAEQKNFLLIVPELTGTAGDFVPSVAEQVRRQLDDEAAILSMVRAVRAAYNVDETRMFITGWSAGGFATLFTGLRNPDVFRAISLRQPNFNPDYFDLCVPFMDRYQPIQVLYGSLDPFKAGAGQAIDWLRAHEFEPTVRERPGGHQRDPETVYDFFVRVVRHSHWVRLQVREDAQDPMRVLLSAKTSFQPVKYLWDFGDGSARTPVAAPEHRYEKPGLYNVRVGLWINDDDRVVRQVQLQVPRVRLGTAESPSTTDAPVTSAPAR